jgi:hypothetical protein
MIGNGAVAKIVLAVTLGGSAGAISYVGLQQLPAAHGAAPSFPWSSAQAGHAGRGPKNDDRSPGLDQSSRSNASGGGCTRGMARRTKDGIVCQADVAAADESRKTAAQGYQPAQGSVRSVDAQRVDGASSSQGTGLFKALTDVLP